MYDQCTENPETITEDTFLCVLLEKLVVAFQSVMLLKGKAHILSKVLYPNIVVFNL